MSTTSMAIFSNPLFATYSVYARNASIFSHFPCLWLYCRDDIGHLIISIKIWFLYDSDEQRRLWFCYFTTITFVTQRL